MNISKYNLMKFYLRYKEFFPAIFFLTGFLFDILTLGRIDDTTNIVMQLAYLGAAFATLSLEILGSHTEKRENKVLQFIINYHDEIYHFLIGGLLSIYTLFFFKSASLASSIVFLFMMLFLLVINELDFFKKFGKKIRTLLFFICLSCFSFLTTPLIFGRVRTMIFILSLVIAFFLMLQCILFWSKKTKTPIYEHLKLSISLISVFLLLYFTKVIPPIPLAIEKIGIYHKVEKDFPKYYLHHQKPWWKFWHTGDQSFKAGPDDKVYVFTRIFSPGGFKDKVYLHWQTLLAGEWKTSDRIPLEITGGRDKGFRGYAFKSNYNPGDWRVLVETQGGREIGRITFTIEQIEGENFDFTVETDE